MSRGESIIRLAIAALLNGALIAILPSLVTLGLYYSLAIHMHRALQDWPTSIGERGFPPPLLLHANVATGYCQCWILATIFGVPLVSVLCALVRPWRSLLPYVGLYIFAFIISCLLAFLAPPRFLEWWWD